MNNRPASPFLRQLVGRITLEKIPFSDRGSRLLLFRDGSRLQIRMAERWSKWETEVGDYHHRAPLLSDWALTDDRGLPLDFELVAYPHALFFRTGLGDFALAFVDEESLYLQMPPGRVGVSFRLQAVNGRIDRRGGEFKGDPEHRRTHRNIAYTTNARLVTNEIVCNSSGEARVNVQMETDSASGFLLGITPRLSFNRSMPRGEDVFLNAEKKWHSWFAQAPRVDERYAKQYYYAWWILRTGLLSPRFFLTREAMIPSMIRYIGVWHWDAFFHALAYRHVDHELAENQLRILLDHQREDGMIPDAIYDEGVVTRMLVPRADHDAEVTKPPLIAWTALKLHSTTNHRDFLDEIYEPLVRWNRWWFEKNDGDGDGIIEYNHPYSSGLDDNPLWDDGMPIESPDLNSYLVLQMDSLSRIAQILKMRDEASRWRSEADALTRRMVSHFWDEQAGVFWATRDHKPVDVLTPFNLFPILTARLPRSISDRLIAHLSSPDEFWTTYPIPSVACNDPKHNPNQMWRGPTWVNVNYLFIDGLARSGYANVARGLRDKTLDLLMQHDDLYEYYNPSTGEPPLDAASVFGWSSAVFVDLAIKASRDEVGSVTLKRNAHAASNPPVT